MSGPLGWLAIRLGHLRSGHPNDAALVMFLDHELDEKRHHEIERHLGSCSECSERAAGIEEAFHGFEQLDSCKCGPVPSLPESGRERLLGAIRNWEANEGRRLQAPARLQNVQSPPEFARELEIYFGPRGAAAILKSKVDGPGNPRSQITPEIQRTLAEFLGREPAMTVARKLNLATAHKPAFEPRPSVS